MHSNSKISQSTIVLEVSFLASLVVQGVVTVLPQPKANEDRLMLELETAKKERREEIIKLESSRKANEARIAVLESSQQQQENRVAEFEKELHTLRQDWVREIENIKRKCKCTQLIIISQ